MDTARTMLPVHQAGQCSVAAASVRGLEAEDIVVRRSYAESPPRVEYELTRKGRALLPIIDEMRRFGHEWLGCEVHSTDAA